jgi:O-antigen/teichoic acid export membrane protein
MHVRLFRGAFWVLLGTVFTRVFSLITTLFIARFLGRGQFGAYGMVDSTLEMFGMFAGLAMGSTMIKYVAEFRSKDPAKAGRILSFARTLSLLTATAIAGAVAVFSPWLAECTLNSPEMGPLLRLGSLLLFASILNNVQVGALSGFEAFSQVARVNLIQGISTPVLAIPLVYFCGLRGAIIAAALVGAIGYILCSLAVEVKCRAYGIRQSYFDFSSFSEYRIIGAFSLPALLAGLLVTPVTWLTNAIVVNQPNGYSELGLFNAANQWRHFVILIPQVLGTVMLPIFAEAHGRDNPQEFRRAFSINLELTWALALPGTVAVIVLRSPLASLFGAQYAATVPIIAVLMLTAFLNIINGVVGTALAGAGRMWIGTLFNLMWAAVLIGLSMLFVPRLGGLGLAMAYLVSYALHSVWQMLYVEIKLVPSSITGQRVLILFTVATLVPVSLLRVNNVPSYIISGVLVCFSLFPLLNVTRALFAKECATNTST